MIRNIITILNLILILTSCKKDRLKEEKSLLVGKWNWVFTQHEFGWCDDETYSEIILATEITKLYALEFQEKGKVSFYEDSKMTETNRTVFPYFDATPGGGFVFYIQLDNKKDQVLEGGVNTDTMWLNYPYVEANPNCENYLNFFVRE